MAKIQDQWECEICGKSYDTPYAVRDEIAVLNGEHSRAYAYVCSKCIQKFCDAIDDLFPNSKYAVRRREAEKVALQVRRTVEV